MYFVFFVLFLVRLVFPEVLPEEVVVFLLVEDRLLRLDPLEILENPKKRFFKVTMRSKRMVITMRVETSIPTTMPSNTEMKTNPINIKYAKCLP